MLIIYLTFQTDILFSQQCQKVEASKPKVLEIADDVNLQKCLVDTALNNTRLSSVSYHRYDQVLVQTDQSRLDMQHLLYS